MKQKGKGRKQNRPPRRRRAPVEREEPESTETPVGQPGTGPRLSGGDVDADWSRADAVGEEAVGGSVATPDQDMVDEIGRALGVEQESEAEVTTSEEILRRRDRLRWHLDHDAEVRAREEEDRSAPEG
jgi:hypothetical protein